MSATTELEEVYTFLGEEMLLLDKMSVRHVMGNAIR